MNRLLPLDREHLADRLASVAMELVFEKSGRSRTDDRETREVERLFRKRFMEVLP